MRIVVVANIVMSLDNVIAVAAAAKGNYLLLGAWLGGQHPGGHCRQRLVPRHCRAFSACHLGRRRRCSAGSRAACCQTTPWSHEYFSAFGAGDPGRGMRGGRVPSLVVLSGWYLARSSDARRSRKSSRLLQPREGDRAMNKALRDIRIGGPDRLLRLSARLPVDLRARGRAARRAHHRPRARRQGQRLHRRRDLRQGRALRRARASSRPADAAAAAHRRQGLAASSRRSPGTTRSIWSPRSSSQAEQRHGAEAVWPYYYAGTMGLVQRDGINRLRHAKKYSGFHSTICVNPAYTGFAAGIGTHRRRRSARDGEVRSGRDLGHQSRSTPRST